jgi:hypothetical protein
MNTREVKLSPAGSTGSATASTTPAATDGPAAGSFLRVPG